jgi:hypothetical protein
MVAYGPLEDLVKVDLNDNLHPVQSACYPVSLPPLILVLNHCKVYLESYFLW